MKILAINGSHRGDQGHTRFLIDLLFQGACAAGAECECISLAKVQVNRCMACGRCHTEKHDLQCVQDEKDHVRGIFRRLETDTLQDTQEEVCGKGKGDAASTHGKC